MAAEADAEESISLDVRTRTAGLPKRNARSTGVCLGLPLSLFCDARPRDGLIHGHAW